ncbi:MAG: ribonucleoside triphosphate reductase, partial [Solobacterium sp.]|nr:ribonucleoside triphosphate reductase [Solobacterium sp.]
MLEGDGEGKRFSYPIPTYAITEDFNWDESDNNSLLFSLAAKYGIPYFANYLNMDIQSDTVRSLNKKTKLDYKKIYRRSGGFFGSGENTGSIGVVTINLPRIAYLSKNEKDFYRRLDRMMDLSARSLHTKRQVLNQLLENGLYPYTRRYIHNFDDHFSSIGIIGMSEACQNANWIGRDLSHEEAQNFAEDVLSHMREKILEYQQEYKCLFSLESSPAEGSSYRLAKKDKEE